MARCQFGQGYGTLTFNGVGLSTAPTFNLVNNPSPHRQEHIHDDLGHNHGDSNLKSRASET